MNTTTASGSAPLKVCQRTTHSLSKASRGAGKGQTMHVSHDHHGGITSIAVEQSPLDGLLAQVHLVDVNHELEQALAAGGVMASMEPLQGPRDLEIRQRQHHLAHSADNRPHPGQLR